jgi:ribulose-phosphate 3-epimerase
MAASIAPSVTARDANEYKHQMDRVARFATRVHIDVADGIFTPVKLLSVEDVWWPGGVRADLHVMYQKPFAHYKTYLSLAPQMVVVHAEAEGGFIPFAELMHRHGIEVGVALKPETPVELIRPALNWIDHVLIFSGNLGHFGGSADLKLIDKVSLLRRLKPQLEIGWDGGINNTNARSLAMGGIDVLNVGGYIQHANDPRLAYGTLARAVV